jgi:hypothetical protein
MFIYISFQSFEWTFYTFYYNIQQLFVLFKIILPLLFVHVQTLRIEHFQIYMNFNMTFAPAISYKTYYKEF